MALLLLLGKERIMTWSEKDHPRDEILFYLLIITLAPIFISMLTLITYFLAKICGIFKGLDKLKNWQAFLVILVLTILLCEFSSFHEHYCASFIDPYKLASWSLFPAFLLYKFFGHLTKRFPKPFVKIGYFCSFECYKGLFKELMSGIKKKG